MFPPWPLSGAGGRVSWEGVTVEVPSDDVAMPDWHDDAIDLTWQNSQPVSPQGALSQDFSQLISQDIKPDIQPFATYPPAMPPPVPVPEPAAEPGAGRGQETRRFDAAAAGGEEEVSGPGGAEEGVERGGMAAAGVGGAREACTVHTDTDTDISTHAHISAPADADTDINTHAHAAVHVDSDIGFGGVGGESACGMHTQPFSTDADTHALLSPDMHGHLSPDVRVLSLQQHDEDRRAGFDAHAEAVAEAVAEADADPHAEANAGAGAEGGLHGRAQGPEGMDVLQQVCTTCDVQGWAESCGGGWAGEFLRAAQGPGADVAGVPVADVAREPASDMAQVEEVPAEEARWLATDSYGSFG
ncbi:unnamed protein product [Closterium sp. NIES-64]|nr:unnamed protein product [Closterium sp. NIES-64]